MLNSACKQLLHITSRNIMSSAESISYSTGSESCSDEAEDNYLSDQSDDLRANTSGIRPYDFEPVGTPISSSSESENDELTPIASNSIIGTTDWCTCGNCRAMETDYESICCQEAVPVDFINGEEGILNHEDFIAICMNSAVLRMTLAAINHFQSSTLPDNNKYLRYAGYRCCTWWIHSRFGRGVRKAVPSCAVWTIRVKYPDPSNNYAPFKE